MAIVSTGQPVSGELLPEAWVVCETIRATHDCVTLVLEREDGAPSTAFSPGQFNMLYQFGIGESAISISGDAAEPGRLVHTIRDVGAVTHSLCGRGLGDFVGVRGPFGSDWGIQEQQGKDIVIVAGGIGLAPLRPVIYHVARNRASYNNVTLLAGARRPRDFLYKDELDAWRALDIQIGMTVDTATRAWTGPIGFVTTLIRRAHFDAGATAAFVCGPELMMRFTAEELMRLGMRPADIMVSMERNMKCAIGLCGHCQFGPEFVCIDGPVFPWPRVRELISIREI